jgi:hypothetical protein
MYEPKRLARATRWGLSDDGLAPTDFEHTRIQKYENSKVVGIYGPNTTSRAGFLRSFLGRRWWRSSKQNNAIEESSSIVMYVSRYRAYVGQFMNLYSSVVGPPGGGRALVNSASLGGELRD